MLICGMCKRALIGGYWIIKDAGDHERVVRDECITKPGRWENKDEEEVQQAKSA